MLRRYSHRNAGRATGVAAQRILKRLSNYHDSSPPPLLDRMVADAQKVHQQRLGSPQIQTFEDMISV